MLISTLSFAFAFFLVSNCAVCLARIEDGENSFRVYKLAQAWPQSTCFNLNRKWSYIKNQCSPCRMPADKVRWTLHGLWPSNTDASDSPSFCNLRSATRFDNLPGDLRRQLEEKWPSFKANNTNEKFWKHEFEKHGSCALDDINTVEKFASKALELLDKYNVGLILQSKGIKPGPSYPFHEIYNAIEKSLGVSPCAQCSAPANSDCQYLIEVYIDLDKTYNLVDCAKGKRGAGNCVMNKDTCYPKMMQPC